MYNFVQRPLPLVLTNSFYKNLINNKFFCCELFLNPIAPPDFLDADSERGTPDVHVFPDSAFALFSSQRAPFPTGFNPFSCPPPIFLRIVCLGGDVHLPRSFNRALPDCRAPPRTLTCSLALFPAPPGP